MTPHFDFVALLPELIISGAFVLVFLADLALPDNKRGAVTVLSVLGCAAAFVATAVLGGVGHRAAMFGGAYVVDDFSLLAKAIFFGSAAVVFLLGAPNRWKGEYCELILASVLGMTLLSSARDLIIFFVSFELFALPGYLLTGWNKKSSKGAEAALKYYLLGALATAVMLYGISFLYGIAGGTRFSDVAIAVNGGGDQVPLVRISILLVLVGMAFKVSAVPFHFWTPDAYEGAPLPVAAFLSVASKAAGFVALMEIVSVALPGGRSVWAPIVFGLAIASILVGNLAALRQTDAVRLLAYSAIAQAGYILIPLAVAHGVGWDQKILPATYEYLVIYGVSNLGAFAAVVGVAKMKKATALDSFDGLFHRSPLLAAALTVFILSLAGIPPLAGWFAKFVVIRDAISTETAPSICLAVVAAVGTAIGLVYYLSFIRRLWLDPQPADPLVDGNPSVSFSLVVVLGLMSVAVIVAGVLPGLITYVGGWSSLLK